MFTPPPFTLPPPPSSPLPPHPHTHTHTHPDAHNQTHTLTQTHIHTHPHTSPHTPLPSQGKLRSHVVALATVTSAAVRLVLLLTSLVVADFSGTAGCVRGVSWSEVATVPKRKSHRELDLNLSWNSEEDIWKGWKKSGGTK